MNKSTRTTPVTDYQAIIDKAIKNVYDSVQMEHNDAMERYNDRDYELRVQAQRAYFHERCIGSLDSLDDAERVYNEICDECQKLDV